MNSQKRIIESNTFMIILIGLIVLTLISWIIGFAAQDINVSIIGLWMLHMQNPVLWIMDMIPVLFYFLGRKVMRFYSQSLNDFDKQMEWLEQRNVANSRFAKEIGSGNYQVEFDVTDEALMDKSLLAMRDNLLENSKRESEQLWISKGKDIVSEILRLHTDLEELSVDTLTGIIKYVNFLQGALYFYDEDSEKLRNVATYAYNRRKYINQEFSIGQGLIGQCAYEMDYIYRTDVPNDYMTITSGVLGDQKPASLLIVPLIADEKLQGVIEFASLDEKIPEVTIKFMRELGEIIARTFFNLRVNKKTENLLIEAQHLSEELRGNEEQLRKATQEELYRTNGQLELKVKEVEQAQRKLNSLLENASEIISIFDRSLRQTYESPSVKKIFGYTPEEVLGGKVAKYTGESAKKQQELLRKLLDNPSETITIECSCIRKNGTSMILEITGRNLIGDPAIGGIILNAVDRTERKRAEKEERLRNKMQSLSENSLDIILRLSLQGDFFYANPVVEDYLHISAKDLRNKNLSDVLMDESLKTYFFETIGKIKSYSNKINTVVEIPVRLGEKTTNRMMNFMAIPEINEGELETILFVGHDITEAKRIEMEIKEKNKKIEDSINYAERIQTSIIPDTKLIKRILPESFIFYRPRDIVSGDFPWFMHNEHYAYIAAVDCTGHGVPGALLSFVGYFTLNNVIGQNNEYSAGSICDKLHDGVRATLKQGTEYARGQDGMDIALVKIDIKTNKIEFAGAHRPLYLLRDGEIIEYKGDRKAIGGILPGRKGEEPFVTHQIQMKKGDKIFFFSDGLPDQLGSPEQKKYSPRRIREQILDHQDYNMSEFSKLFENDFYEWKADFKQTDDVLLIGIGF